MAIKRISENPKVTDTVLFDILTPDAEGCFLSNPYKVDRVTIFFIEKNFISTKDQELERKTFPEEKIRAVEEAEKAACANPTEENILNVQTVRAEAEESAQINVTYFNTSTPVEVVGTPEFPAWLSTDIDNAFIENIPFDANGNPQYGVFRYTWNPVGRREGTYVICWTWTPNPAGDSLSAHIKFDLSSDTKETTTIPTHRTTEGKYETLLENYLPETFKMRLSEDDLTPETLQSLNKSVAKGFTVLEDMTNQLVDLQDANVLHESFITYLSNLFNLKLRSGDPTLWRRQTKNAIPLFKKKGTLEGLQQALAQAGMSLLDFVQFWQVVSPYTWQDAFLIEDEEQIQFDLSKITLPVDPLNFGLFLLPFDEEEWISLPPEYVGFSTMNNVTTMTWLGDTLSTPILLEQGDILRVLYKYRDIPSASAQAIENYIRDLELADQRDPKLQKYPPKNWNVKVISEDDPLFNVIVPDKHPFHEPLIFGNIRTEFPYSENVYNMDEYNGSKRKSHDPCDIEKDFIDPCGACISSKFAVDVEIEELTNDRIFEAQEIIKEFKPFHSILHAITFAGGIEDFVQTIDTDINVLVTFKVEDVLVAGQANSLFTRVIRGGLNINAIKREVLADSELIIADAGATGYNTKIVIFSPNVQFDKLGLDQDGNVLDILAPSTHAGKYRIKNPKGNIADIFGAGALSEPIDTKEFTFKLSNIVYENPSTNIFQDDIFNLSDEEVDYTEIGILGTDCGGNWKVSILAGSTSTLHNIKTALPDGSLLLDDPDRVLPISTMSGLTYTLFNGDTAIIESDNGNLKVRRRGRVDKNDTRIDDIRNFVNVCDFIEIEGIQYEIVAFENENEFYIANYDGDDKSGIFTTIFKRLVDSETAFLSYFGNELDTDANLEASLGIASTEDVNAVEGNRFKENFLLVIDGEFHKIEAINNSRIVLGGPEHFWTTLPAGGTRINYSVFRFTKNSITIGGHEFAFLDRRGQEQVDMDVETLMPLHMNLVDALNTSSANDVISQEHQISYQVDYKGGVSEPEKVIKPPKRVTFRVGWK